jgi:Holliday junction resolvase
MKTKVKAKTICKITENDVKRQVKDYLSLKGWFHFYNLAGMGAYKGIPDIIAIKGGRVLFIECKRPARGSKQSPAQVQFQDNIEAQGGEYVLVRCLEDLIKANV